MKNCLSSFILTVLISTSLSSQTQTCSQNIDDLNLQTMTQVVGSETITREYILHIPTDYDETSPTPLIINMHGFGDCATDYAESIGDFYNFKELANEENIIVAYPQGAYRPEKEDTYWEPGDSGEDNIYENDVYFIEELVTDISSEYNLDQDMIYACGYSNGGMMAYSLACNRSSLFSAIGIMSGTMLEEDCTVQEPVPVIKFHGIADGVLPYDGGYWYQSAQEVVDFWLEQNDIDESSLVSSQPNGGKVSLDEYSGGNSSSCLSFYTINEEFDKPGDHVWFSENIDGISPNTIMWNFFKNNCAVTNTTNTADQARIELYPNPVIDLLEIKNAKNQDYSIYDVSGKLLLSGRLGSTKEVISMEKLQRGYYTIKIGEQSRKFVKGN